MTPIPIPIIANEDQPRRKILAIRKTAAQTKASCKLQSNTSKQLDASGIQDGSFKINKREEIPDSQPSSSKPPQKLSKTTSRKKSQELKQNLSLDTNQMAVYDALEDMYGLPNHLLEEGLSYDRDNRASSHSFSNALRESSASCNTTAQTKFEESEGASSAKWRRTTNLEYEEAAVYAEAGKENRGFVSTKKHGQVVAKKRSEGVE